MILLRNATLFDAQVCFELWLALSKEEQALCKDHEDVQFPAWHAGMREKWARRFADALASPGVRYVLACDKTLDKPVGYMVFSVGSRDGVEPSHFLQIHELYVQESYRGTLPDRAAAMLQYTAAEWARELQLKTVEITCVPVEKQIQRWTRMGFKATQVRLVRNVDGSQ